MKIRRRYTRIALIGLGLGIALPLPADTTADAKGFIERMLGEVQHIVNDDASAPHEKRALMAREMRNYLDFTFMSRAALGDHYEDFSKEQFAEFSFEYERHLTNAFSARVARYRAKGSEVTGAELLNDRGYYLVRTKTDARAPMAVGIAPRDESGVDYRLRRRDGRWRIMSITIDGVNMSANFRKQFAALLRKHGGADSVIAMVRRRNEDNEDFNPFALKRERK